jgi:hypothetical protein
MLDYINIKVSLVIKMNIFHRILNKAILAMLVTFHVNVIVCQNFNLPHTYCVFFKNFFNEMKAFTFFTWLTNMFQTM